MRTGGTRDGGRRWGGRATVLDPARVEDDEKSCCLAKRRISLYCHELYVHPLTDDTVSCLWKVV